MSGGKKTWWIPSIDMGFTFYNLGKCSGEVSDIRIIGNLKSRNDEKKYGFYAKWIVAYPKFEPIRQNRFEWIESSVIRDWYPLILTGDEQKSLHIIFEGWRWDEKYTGDLSLSLQVFSSEKEKWIEYDKYSLIITKDMYEKGETHTLQNPKLQEIRGNLFEEWCNVPSIEGKRDKSVV